MPPHYSLFESAYFVKAHDGSDMLARIKAAVAEHLDKIQAEYVAGCRETPSAAGILEAFKRLKDDARMDKAWKELTAKTRKGEYEYPVIYREFRDEDRIAALVEELDRRDQESGEKRGDRDHWINSLKTIGGEEERLILAAVNLAARTARLVIDKKPVLCLSLEKKIDDRQAAINKAMELLEKQGEIRDFLLSDKTTYYDASVFKTLDFTIIPALNRNLASKKASIYKRMEVKSAKKFPHLQGPIVILGELVRRLFGEEVKLLSPIAHLLSVAFGDDISKSYIQNVFNSAAKNASTGV